MANQVVCAVCHRVRIDGNWLSNEKMHGEVSHTYCPLCVIGYYFEIAAKKVKNEQELRSLVRKYSRLRSMYHRKQLSDDAFRPVVSIFEKILEKKGERKNTEQIIEELMRNEPLIRNTLERMAQEVLIDENQNKNEVKVARLIVRRIEREKINSAQTA